jgi:hypothetical protein
MIASSEKSLQKVACFSACPLNQLLTANINGTLEVTPDENRRIGRIKEDFGGQNALEFTVANADVIELDHASGSVGLDLMAEVPITRLELTPQSATHRVTVDNIQVFTSQPVTVE